MHRTGVRLADWKSAIQQDGILRYKQRHAPLRGKPGINATMNATNMMNMTIHNHLAGRTPVVHTQDRCKVCTKQIRVGEDHVRVFHAGNYYVVCCASCATKFEAHPQQYLVS